ncbi:MAG: hypothetical protein SNJ70_01670 [Armatimonadota bacterium]
MNIYIRLWVCVALVLFSFCNALADDVFLSDARLQANVSYSTLTVQYNPTYEMDETLPTYKPLFQIIDEISVKTGIELISGENENDWFCRDRKLVIFARDMKISELLTNIASVLNFTWIKEGSAEKQAYRIIQSDEQKDREVTLRDNFLQKKNSEENKKRTDVLVEIESLSKMTSEQSESLKSTNEWKYLLSTEGLAESITIFFNVFDAAKVAFLDGIEANFAYSELSDTQKSAVKKLAENYNELMKSIGAQEDYKALIDNIDKLQIAINRQETLQADDVISKSKLGSVALIYGDKKFEIPMFELSSPAVNALAKAIIALKSGRNIETVQSQLTKDLLDISKKSKSIANPVAVPTDSELNKSITLYTDDRISPLPEMLYKISEKAKMNIVSDYFPTFSLNISGGAKLLIDHLKIIKNEFDKNWQKKSNTLLFTDDKWFVKRSEEVPEVWINYWLTRSEINKGIVFEDMLQIAILRDEQLENSILKNYWMLNAGVSEIIKNKNILRFYASLSQEQMNQISQGKLSVESLSDNQWKLLRDALSDKGYLNYAANKSNQLISFERTLPDVNFQERYTITFHPTGDSLPVTFQILKGTNIYGEFKATKKPVVSPN